MPTSARLIVVGKNEPIPGATKKNSVTKALGLLPTLKPDFATIQEGIDEAARRIKERDKGAEHNFMDRITVLVLPGVYAENVVCKEWVTVVGTNIDSVFIYGGSPANPALPAITLSSNCSVNDLSILNPSDMDSQQYAIRGTDVVGLGLLNINIFPASSPEKPPFSRGKVLGLFGQSSTAIITNLGASYFGDEFAVDLWGPAPDSFVNNNAKPRGRDTVGWNADCHLINCFFDALFTAGTDGGCVRIRDRFETHLRNCLLRTTHPDLTKALGAAVRIETSAINGVDGSYPDARVFHSKGKSPLIEALLENCSLYCPGGLSPRILHVGKFSICRFYNSIADSIRLSTLGRLIDGPERGLTLENV